ncbi:MAG: hypothetical protein WDZ90_00935 [Candidatus Paceibacterota bacterium]
MFDFFDTLRKKTEEERRAIALSFAFLVTFLIVVVWLSTLYFLSEESKEQRVRSGTEVKDESLSFDIFLSDIRDSFGSIRSQIEELRK